MAPGAIAWLLSSARRSICSTVPFDSLICQPPLLLGQTSTMLRAPTAFPVEQAVAVDDDAAWLGVLAIANTAARIMAHSRKRAKVFMAMAPLRACEAHTDQELCHAQ